MSAKQTEAKQSVAFFSGANFSSGKPQFSVGKNAAGADVTRVSGQPVFRSGTFRDSMGYEHTYDPFHMAQIVSNFDMLHSQKILNNLPVRAGHPSPFTNYMNEMIGHLVSLSTAEFTSPADGQTYTYLLADYDIIDPQAAEKISSGLWVNRSAEIGMYETNDGMAFYPTFMGFAYVDIPAVEGLNFSRNAGFNSSFVVACDVEMEGALMGDNNTGSAQQAAPFNFALATGPTTDFAAVQKHITAIEGENAGLKTEKATLATEVETLKAFQAEVTTANRNNFVKGLITSNKVLAAQETALVEYVGSLTPEQFASYQSIMDGAPQVPLLGSHGTVDSTSGTPDVDQTSETDVEVAAAQRLYDRHKTAGMPHTQLIQTPSYKKLVAAGKIAA